MIIIIAESPLFERLPFAFKIGVGDVEGEVVVELVVELVADVVVELVVDVVGEVVVKE